MSGIGSGINRAALKEIAGGNDNNVLQTGSVGQIGDLARDLLKGICKCKCD